MTKRRDTDEVDVEAFAEFCRTHPAMLMPAFAMQTTMRERIMGGAWWDRRSNERVKVGRHTMRIHDLLKAHLQEDAFHSFMRAVDSGDAKALKRDADKHRDWKSATEVTGTVAQRRRKSGQHELQDRPLDKYSRSSARRRVKSLDDTRKVRPDQNAAVRRSFESKPRGREAFGSRLSAAVRKERRDPAEAQKPSARSTAAEGRRGRGGAARRSDVFVVSCVISMYSPGSGARSALRRRPGPSGSRTRIPQPPERPGVMPVDSSPCIRMRSREAPAADVERVTTTISSVASAILTSHRGPACNMISPVRG